MPSSSGSGSFSITAPRMSEMDAQREWNEMSEEEQKLVTGDLYGEREPTEETPELVQTSLEELDRYLTEEVPWYMKVHYEKALQRCPTYVKSPEFQIAFLRCEHFDVPKAATRLIKYWHLKEDVFGEDKAYLGRKLRIEDLSDDDLATGRSNGVQILPGRDKSGRGFVFSHKYKWEYKDRYELLRWVWYCGEYALEFDDLQKHGCNLIGFDDGPFSLARMDRKLENRLLVFATQGFPLRFVSCHVCYDATIYELFLPLLRFLMGKDLRARLRLYPKKHYRRLDDFKSYGIPANVLPTVMGGGVELNTAAWIEQRRAEGR